MPGSSPNAAVEAFLDPLREAASCLGGAHFTLTPGARGDVGKTHVWTLNRGMPMELLSDHPLSLQASMRFETQDRGQSMGRERFRVSTREYIYGVRIRGRELYSAHWHPHSSSPVVDPHWHIGDVALAPDGIYLERAHVPSPRVSFEGFIKMILEQLPVTPHFDDWRQRLEQAETRFKEHRSWS